MLPTKRLLVILFLLGTIIMMLQLNCCPDCPNWFEQRRNLSRHRGSCFVYKHYVTQQARVRHKRQEAQARGEAQQEVKADDRMDIDGTGAEELPMGDPVSALAWAYMKL